ncbi:uncharacterized protein TNCV_847341 [Trichonephila clavipes]|nr:uncharacterized protein TNCV_847341 [Trichonephila clavipes]
MSRGESFGEASLNQTRQMREEIKQDILRKLRGGGSVKSATQNNVTFEDYKENTCLYAFDLTQDFSANDPFVNVTPSGDILIHLKFDADLPEIVTLIADVEIDKS